MAKQKIYGESNWAPLDVKNIVASVKRVFKTGDISKLTKKAYDHIIQHMGFIAHYNLYGFQAEYSNIQKFAETLMKSENSQNYNYNWHLRARYVRDPFFGNAYGMDYCHSVADANTEILRAAMDYLGIKEVG
jgi:hypothetical protein